MTQVAGYSPTAAVYLAPAACKMEWQAAHLCMHGQITMHRRAYVVLAFALHPDAELQLFMG